LYAKGALGRVETKNRFCHFGEKRKLSENEQHFRENLLQKIFVLAQIFAKILVFAKVFAKMFLFVILTTKNCEEVLSK
jgi:hypothetical protein